MHLNFAIFTIEAKLLIEFKYQKIFRIANLAVIFEQAMISLF